MITMGEKSFIQDMTYFLLLYQKLRASSCHIAHISARQSKRFLQKKKANHSLV
jgi:hypothetical protein